MTETELTAARAELVQLLRGHDWYYDRSDDSRVYREGAQARARIVALRAVLPDGIQLWNAYAPVGCKLDVGDAS